jgi:hypothetical protein
MTLCKHLISSSSSSSNNNNNNDGTLSIFSTFNPVKYYAYSLAAVARLLLADVAAGLLAAAACWVFCYQ